MCLIDKMNLYRDNRRGRSLCPALLQANQRRHQTIGEFMSNSLFWKKQGHRLETVESSVFHQGPPHQAVG